jgi:hypothetical protein
MESRWRSAVSAHYLLGAARGMRVSPGPRWRESPGGGTGPPAGPHFLLGARLRPAGPRVIGPPGTGEQDLAYRPQSGGVARRGEVDQEYLPEGREVLPRGGVDHRRDSGGSRIRLWRDRRDTRGNGGREGAVDCRISSGMACSAPGIQPGVLGHVLIENRNGLVVDTRVTQAHGRAEREAALEMLGVVAGQGWTRRPGPELVDLHPGGGPWTRPPRNAEHPPVAEATTVDHQRLGGGDR